MSGVVQLDILVNVADIAGLFDQMEVWRSLTGSAGPYVEVTADSWRSAKLPIGAGDPPNPSVTGAAAALVTKKLQLLLNDVDEIDVTFTGSDPLTRTTAASQITAQSGGRLTSYVDAAGNLVVATVEPGSGALLEVLGGTAAADLGLTVGSVGYGQEPRIQVVSSQQLYRFQDLRGEDTAYYRTRYRNSANQTVSDFSAPFEAGGSVGLADTSLVVGVADLVDLSGAAIAFRSVLVHVDFTGILAEGRLMSGTDRVVTSDADGHVVITLVRGQRVRVAVAGTDLVREITVPTDPTVQVFNLFDPTVGKRDVFKVQVPNIVYAERRSL